MWRYNDFNAPIRRFSPDIMLFEHWCYVGLLDEESLKIPIAIDLHGPHLLERTFQKHANLCHNVLEKIGAIGRADYYVCAGEKQRIYFLPWLLLAGVDICCGNVISAIPISLDPELPRHEPSGETTFVYGGVFLPWQNPMKGLGVLVKKLEAHKRGLLKFFGGEHPIRDINTGLFSPIRKTLEKSPRVKFYGMINHDELLKEYQHAHVAMDLMEKNTERELAFTTRTVEYLWCGLPVIYNNYSELAQYISEYNAGWTVDPEDTTTLERVIETIINNPGEVTTKGENAQRLVRERLVWDKTIEPLDRFCQSPYKREKGPTFAQLLLKQNQSFWDKALTILVSEGPFSLARKSYAKLKLLRRSN